MSSQHENPESLKVYDFDELSEITALPALAVCEDLRPIVEEVIDDSAQARVINHGILEILKNVELHGEETMPRLVVVYREIGGLAISTINTIKPNTEQFGLGQLYIEGVFGERYKKTVIGDTYMGHLYIPHENCA